MTEDNGGSSSSARFTCCYLPLAGRPTSAGFLSAGQHWIDQIRLRRRSRQENGQGTLWCNDMPETEIWKRSGAWFYKTLPRSQMASCPSSPTGSTRTPGNATSPTDLVGPSHTLSETDNNEWVQVQPRNVIGSPSKTDGFVPNLACETTSSKAMNTPPQNLDITAGKESIFGMFNANGTAGKVHPYPEKQRKVIGSESPRSVPMNPCADPSCRPSMATSPTLVPPLPFHPAFSNTRSQGTSTASALAQSFGLLNASKKVASLTGESTLPSGPTTSPSVPSRRSSRVASDDAPFGILYFTLYHDTINKQLHVAIHKAKNLIAMDANGLSDPYVVCQILPSSHNSARPRTSTRPQCLNPVWNEALTFEPFEEKNMHQKTLRLAVLDEDLYGSDWLGEYWLSLSRLTSDRLTDFAVPLGPRKPLHRGEFDLACPTRGKIQLGLRYLEEKRQLCVEVIRCSDLAPMDQNGLSDPFVKLYLRPDKAKKTKQKTQVKKATLFPEFHEQFCYEMSPSEAGNRTLEVTVWDFDRGPSNDFIGGLTLGAGAKAERRELWLAVFRPPFRRIEAWFQLSSRNDPGDQSSTPGVCD
ncbi:Rabphilin-3A [Fasciola gigantica]|uniref:Rabphilin-3A n=1 Tax=Fasciola gigantica TaxID=46835 RepID=A0A504YKY7_FASGI|nr:Rabphilin-3A [Fasciola gigantica]